MATERQKQFARLLRDMAEEIDSGVLEVLDFDWQAEMEETERCPDGWRNWRHTGRKILKVTTVKKT